MINLFFSYSHKDEELRNELDKHLSILKRQGKINAWHDRCIIAGSDFAHDISNNLRNADIILLLISSDFIASDYCFDIEMQLAMEMHENSTAIVIPIILRPCAWHDTPFGKLTAIPKDGRPVVKFPSYDEAFLEITNELTRVIDIKSPKKTEQPHVINPTSSESLIQPRSSNLRIAKSFSDHERDSFLDDAFGYIANYFEGSLEELKSRNQEVDYIYKRIDSQTFSAAIYINGEHKTECMISYGAQSPFSKNSIIFSSNISSARNSFNESMSVADDGYKLYLRPMGMGFNRVSGDLTNEGAAEYFWSMLIERLQRQ